jgi:hypothetical protein
MVQRDEVNDFLLGGDKVPSASFLTIGTVHEGEIVAMKKSQQTDVDTRKPLFWDNGDPKMQVVITIQTEENDPEFEDDDGRRRLYLKYKMADAVRDAIKAAEAEDGLQLGGWLGVEFVKQDKPASRAKSGVKHFEAWYEAPDPAASINEFLEGGGDEPADEPEPVVEAPPVTTRGRKAAAPAEDTPVDPEPAKASRGRGKAAPAAPARRGRRAAASTEGQEPF